MTIEIDNWKAVRLQEPADTSVFTVFKKKEQEQPSLHGYYMSKLDAITGSYEVGDLPEIICLCEQIKHSLQNPA